MGNLFTADMVKKASLAAPAPEETGILGSNDSELPFFANPDVQKVQPGQPLQGGVTQNVNLPDLALRSSILGFLETPEVLGNAAASLAQQGMPVEQRTNVADWLHSLGVPQSPGEILDSPRFQQQVQQAGPLGGIASTAGRIGGGFLFPLGAIGAGGKVVAQGAKAIPAVSKMAAPIAQGVGKALPMIQNPVAKAGLIGAGQGVGYGAAFGQGQQFGKNKQNMTPQQAATTAGVGGLLGGGMGAGFAKLGQIFQGRAQQAAPQIGDDFMGVPTGGGNFSPTTTGNMLETFINQNPDQAQRAVDVATRRTAKRGPVYREKITEVQKRSAIRENREAASIEKTRGRDMKQERRVRENRIFRERDVRERRAYAEGQKAQTQARQDERAALNRADRMKRDELKRSDKRVEKQEQREYNERKSAQSQAIRQGERAETRAYNEGRDAQKVATRANERAENRQYQEKRDDLRRQDRKEAVADRERQVKEGRAFADSRDAKKRGQQLSDLSTKEGKTGSRTTSSNEYYTKLYDRIGRAESVDDLRELEKRIYSSPEAKDGSRLLDNDQRQNLARQLRQRNRELKDEGKAKPGESEGAAPAKPVAQKKEAADPTIGEFRKTIRNREKPREKRHESALSADSIAKIGKLGERETEDFKRAIDEIAEAHVEIQYAKRELENLAEWALNNPKEWKDPTRSFKAMEAEDGLMIAKAGAAKGFLMRSRLEKKLSAAQQAALSKTRNDLVEEGIARGDIQPKQYKDALEVVVGGKADYTEVTSTGRLKVLGMQKIAAVGREKPKSIQDLYERVERIRGRIASHTQAADEAKEELLPLAQRVFQEQKDAWTGRQAPAFAVHHTDEHGHVTSVTFKQGSLRYELNEATQDLRDQLNALHEQFMAKTNLTKQVNEIVEKSTSGLRAFTGFEPIIAAPLIAKAVGKRAAQLTKATEQSALFVGTLRDIFKAHPQYMGDKIAAKFDEMNGQILEAFAKNGKRMVKISGGEDLTELLNKFKGVPADEIMFAPIKGVTQAERETAALFRSKYKELAETIEPVLEEMKARGRDIKYGIQEGRKYSPSQLKNGKLSTDAHSKLYEEALQVMHDAALLKGQHWDMASGAFATLLNRKNASIFGNNPKVGLANFVDPAPMMLVEFGRHWLSAGVAINRKGVKAALNKLPIVPQADLTSIEMQQRKLLAKPEPSNIFERAVGWHETISEFLGNKTDFVFKGKEKLTGLADRKYTRQAVLASIHRQAKIHGMKGDDLVDALVLRTRKINAGLERKIWKEVSGDLAQLVNTLNPTMNRDLFADSLVGKMTAAYSRPQRRVGRYMYNLMKGDMKDKGKFIAASLMYLGLGGRAVLPTSVRKMIIYAGSVGLGFQAKDAVDAMQNLDKANALENLTGWDLSDRISYDAVNIAAPTLEDLSALSNDITAVRNGETVEARAGRVAMRIVTSLALFPKVAGMGVGYLNSVGNNFRYAGEGSRPLYVTVGHETKKVPIPYDFNDAWRDSILAGGNPKGKGVKAAVEQALANKIDARRNAMTSRLIPSAAAE